MSKKEKAYSTPIRDSTGNIKAKSSQAHINQIKAKALAQNTLIGINNNEAYLETNIKPIKKDGEDLTFGAKTKVTHKI